MLTTLLVVTGRHHGVLGSIRLNLRSEVAERLEAAVAKVADDFGTGLRSMMSGLFLYLTWLTLDTRERIWNAELPVAAHQGRASAAL